MPIMEKPEFIIGSPSGDYDIEPIHFAAGGLSKVYDAVDKITGEGVIIKTSKYMESSIYETYVYSNFYHPNIVRTYKIYFDPETSLFSFVMEYGFSLNLFDRKLHDVIKVVTSVIKGLIFLEKNGIVHGDIKIINAIMDEDDVTKLIDFGLMYKIGYGEVPVYTQTFPDMNGYKINGIIGYTGVTRRELMNSAMWALGIMIIDIINDTVGLVNRCGTSHGYDEYGVPNHIRELNDDPQRLIREVYLPNHPVLWDVVEKLMGPPENRYTKFSDILEVTGDTGGIVYQSIPPSYNLRTLDGDFIARNKYMKSYEYVITVANQTNYRFPDEVICLAIEYYLRCRKESNITKVVETEGSSGKKFKLIRGLALQMVTFLYLADIVYRYDHTEFNIEEYILISSLEGDLEDLKTSMKMYIAYAIEDLNGNVYLDIPIKRKVENWREFFVNSKVDDYIEKMRDIPSI